MIHPRSEELIQLADIGDTDGVLAIVSLEEIAQAWCDETAASMALPQAEQDDGIWETGPEWWPFSFMFNCLRHRPELCRELLVRLVARAPNDDVLGAIGAGPLEDWQRFSSDQQRWMQEQATKDPRFAHALGNMRENSGDRGAELPIGTDCSLAGLGRPRAL